MFCLLNKAFDCIKLQLMCALMNTKIKVKNFRILLLAELSLLFRRSNIYNSECIHLRLKIKIYRAILVIIG